MSENFTDFDRLAMRRCLELAARGRHSARPNPMVGAVLAHNEHILAEGWHRVYGGPHAEVDAFAALVPGTEALLGECTLYVNLEPCSYYGKTPPCSDLIVRKKPGRVVVGSPDPNKKVSGAGIAHIKKAGISVSVGLLREDCLELNRHFFCFHQKKRPWVTLKWAQSADGYLALPGPQQVQISGEMSRRLTHSWRADHMAILIGRKTAEIDNPRLNVRYGGGPDPLKVILDLRSVLPKSLHLFEQPDSLLLIRSEPGQRESNEDTPLKATSELHQVFIDPKTDVAAQILQRLYEKNMLSVMVEGGAELLHTFIDAGLWDESLVFKAPTSLYHGLKSPVQPGTIIDGEIIGCDRLTISRPQNTSPH